MSAAILPCRYPSINTNIGAEIPNDRIVKSQRILNNFLQGTELRITEKKWGYRHLQHVGRQRDDARG